MDKQKAVILGPQTAASVSTRKTLTYVNGVYTVQTSNVPMDVTPTTLTNKYDPTVTATTNSSTAITFPVMLSSRHSQYKPITSAPIPNSVMEIREELSQVQAQLKRKLQSHAVAQHKVQLINKNGLKDGEDGESAKAECRTIEGEISDLKSRQNMLIDAVRDALVVVGNKLPNSRVRKSDIAKNVNLYNPSRSKAQSPVHRTALAKRIKLSPPAVSLSSTTSVTTSQPSSMVVGFVIPSLSAANTTICPPPLKVPAVYASTSVRTLTSTGACSQSSPKTKPATVQAVTATAPSLAPTRAAGDTTPACTVIEESDDIEVIEMKRSRNKLNKLHNKPQLLPKPVSMSPVPRSLGESQARYSSVQEAHLQAIKKVNNEVPDKPKNEELMEFMTSLDLVTPDALESLQRKKTERRTMTRSRFERLTGKRPNEYLNSLSNSMAWKRPRRTNTASPPAMPAVPPLTRGRRATPPPPTTNLSEDDGSLHDDYCATCSKSGELLMCDTCTQVFHLHCIGLQRIPAGKWSCAKCVAVDTTDSSSVETSKPGSAMAAVQQFVKHKAVKDEQRMKLLSRNTELMDKSRELKNVLDELKKQMENSLAENNSLKAKNQQTRTLLQQMVGVVRAIKRSHK